MIPPLDMKLLWGRAAGRCSICNADLTVDLDATSPVVIGEMAHVISEQELGPRGTQEIDRSSRNRYDNVILLCPTHHRLVDKAPSEYSVQRLLELKKAHESRVRDGLKGRPFSSRGELFSCAQRLLRENKEIYERFGPASCSARSNPLSRLANVWELRKVAKVVPNNMKIVAMFELNEHVLASAQHRIFVKFREHAVAFQESAMERLGRDEVPSFPEEFGKMLEAGG